MINLRCFILQKRGCATTHILVRINLSDLYIFIAHKSRITATEAIKLTLRLDLRTSSQKATEAIKTASMLKRLHLLELFVLFYNLNTSVYKLV